MEAYCVNKAGADSVFLDQQSLERLTAAWEKWASQAVSPARLVARARPYLVFLLIRHGGLRVGEAISINAAQQLDRETGMLAVPGANGRSILLPVEAMRPLRRILSLPEADDPAFCNLDPGFLRRTFYAVAQLAGIAPAAGGPRAIRAARGNELLATHMPLELARNYLGLRKPSQLDAFMRGAAGSSGNREANTFPAIIEASLPGSETVLITCRTLGGIELACLCPMDVFMRLEPRRGMVFYTSVNKSMIVLAEDRPACSAANILPCVARSIREDAAKFAVELSLNKGERLLAAVESSGHLRLRPGMRLHAIFPAGAVTLLPAG